ncbi:hypothetical protein RRG08_017070 [Elysia crispata]|uniref:Uncharacterized protein n=1 Tax=Elysia crispata TaxID=231223 RepID=A0AAE0ZV59_9GAST|nr:hypothetical protein RRG08_017070 [Elysia crispata]
MLIQRACDRDVRRHELTVQVPELVTACEAEGPVWNIQRDITGAFDMLVVALLSNCLDISRMITAHVGLKVPARTEITKANTAAGRTPVTDPRRFIHNHRMTGLLAAGSPVQKEACRKPVGSLRCNELSAEQQNPLHADTGWFNRFSPLTATIYIYNIVQNPNVVSTVLTPFTLHHIRALSKIDILTITIVLMTSASVTVAWCQDDVKLDTSIKSTLCFMEPAHLTASSGFTIASKQPPSGVSAGKTKLQTYLSVMISISRKLVADLGPSIGNTATRVGGRDRMFVETETLENFDLESLKCSSVKKSEKKKGVGEESQRPEVPAI